MEKTNEPYAIAKIAGVKLCESLNIQYQTSYKCLMPCNLYGPGDNYDPISSHFFSALISKIYFAKINKKNKITLWGSGKPLREIMYVDDLSDAIIFFLKKNIKTTIINTGSGDEKSILQYAKFIMEKLDCKLKIDFDKSKPEGTTRKLLDSSIANSYGWKSKINLTKGLKATFHDFLTKNIITK